MEKNKNNAIKQQMLQKLQAQEKVQNQQFAQNKKKQNNIHVVMTLAAPLNKTEQNNLFPDQQIIKQVEDKDANLQKLSQNPNLNKWEIIDNKLNTNNSPFASNNLFASSNNQFQPFNSTTSTQVTFANNNIEPKLFTFSVQPPTLNSSAFGANNSIGFGFGNSISQPKDLNSSINQNNNNSFSFGSFGQSKFGKNQNTVSSSFSNTNSGNYLNHPPGFSFSSKPNQNVPSSNSSSFGSSFFSSATHSNPNPNSLFGSFGPTTQTNFSPFSSLNQQSSSVPKFQLFSESNKVPFNSQFGQQTSNQNQVQFMNSNKTPQKNKAKIYHILKNISNNSCFATNIKQLKMSNCGIQNQQLKQMIQGVKWTSLQKLYLSLNMISDISCLTEQNIPNVTWLTLMYNCLDNKSCQFLCKRKWKKLQKLSISFAKQNRQQNTIYFFQNIQSSFQTLNTLWVAVPSNLPFGEIQLVAQIMKKRSGYIYYYHYNGWYYGDDQFNQKGKQQQNLKYNNLSETNKLKLKLYAASLGKSFDPDEDQKKVNIWKEFQSKQSAPNDFKFPSTTMNEKQSLFNKNHQQLIGNKVQETFQQSIDKFQKLMRIAQSLQIIGPGLIANSQIQKAFQCFSTIVNLTKKVIVQKQDLYRKKIKKNPQDPIFKNNPFGQAIKNDLKTIKLNLNSLGSEHIKNFDDNIKEIQKFIQHVQTQQKHQTVPSQMQVQKIINAVVYQEKYMLCRYLKFLAKTLQLKKMQKQAYKTYFQCKIIYEELMRTPFQLLISTIHQNGFGFGIQQQSHTIIKKQSWMSVHDNFYFSQSQYVHILKRIKNILETSKDEIVLQRQKQLQRIQKKLSQHQ